jgi:hypothetical protein
LTKHVGDSHFLAVHVWYIRGAHAQILHSCWRQKFYNARYVIPVQFFVILLCSSPSVPLTEHHVTVTRGMEEDSVGRSTKSESTDEWYTAGI